MNLKPAEKSLNLEGKGAVMMVVRDKGDVADGARVADADAAACAAERIKRQRVMQVKAGEWKQVGTLLIGLGE